MDIGEVKFRSMPCALIDDLGPFDHLLEDRHVDPEEAVKWGVEVGEDVAQHGDGVQGQTADGVLKARGLGLDQHHAKQGHHPENLQERPPVHNQRSEQLLELTGSQSIKFVTRGERLDAIVMGEMGADEIV